MEITARVTLCIFLIFYLIMKIAADGTKKLVIKEWEVVKIAILMSLLAMGGFFGDVI